MWVVSCLTGTRRLALTEADSAHFDSETSCPDWGSIYFFLTNVIRKEIRSENVSVPLRCSFLIPAGVASSYCWFLLW